MLLRKCCCIVSLRTGSLCTGIFYMSQDFTIFYDRHYKVWVMLLIFQSIINGCMLFGALKDSKYFLIPWMVFYGAFLVIGTFLIVLIAIVEPITSIFLLIIGLFGYFWLVVLSYYIILNSATNTDSAAFDKELPVYDNSVKYLEVN